MAKSKGWDKVSGYEKVVGNKKKFKLDKGGLKKTFRSNQRKIRQKKRRTDAGKAKKGSRGPKGSRGQVNRRR